MVKKVFSLLLLLCLQADSSENILILYKSGKAKALENHLFDSPNTNSFTSNLLSGKDLRFGYFEKAISLLTCNKDKGILELYAPNTQKQFSLQKRYSAFTGKYSGDKMEEGDLRTPIGVYSLTQKKTNVDPFYGPMAFVTSYPNLYDRIRGKNGDGIWIHGVPFNGTRDKFTKGCIAIQNNDLLHLDQHINPSKTLLIIDSGPKKQVSPSIYSTIINSIGKWKNAWIDNDLEEYLSFYDTAFKRFDGMGFNQFKSYKERVFAKNDSKTIDLSDLSIIPYPGKANLFYVNFIEKYNSDTYKFEGEKSLLITLKSDNTISILVEE